MWTYQRVKSMIDSSDRFARTIDGNYHKTICPPLNRDDVAETLTKLPDSAELAPCCSG
jgi:uncharacterized protein Yka (UPF0111/DUF47 family)